MVAACARRPASLAVHADGVAADDSAACGDASQQIKDDCCSAGRAATEHYLEEHSWAWADVCLVTAGS